MTHISIIIVSYNSNKDTRECLESLVESKTTGFSYSVIIVDNASYKPFSLPKKLDPSLFEVIRSESNLGFTGGNNLGIRYAIEKYNSEYILLLNNDTIVDPLFLKKLLGTAQSNSEIGIVTPMIHFAPGTEFHNASYQKKDRGNVIWYAGGSIDWNNVAAYHRGVDEVNQNHFSTVSTVDFATGCCMLIKREVLEKIKLFDQRYFLYLEDVDLSLRAQQAGYSVVFDPSALIWHKNAGSSGGSGSPVHVYYQTRNRLFFALKYGTWRTKKSALIISLQALLKGSTVERKAVLHFLTGQLGKQPII